MVVLMRGAKEGDGDQREKENVGWQDKQVAVTCAAGGNCSSRLFGLSKQQPSSIFPEQSFTKWDGKPAASTAAGFPNWYPLRRS